MRLFLVWLALLGLVLPPLPAVAAAECQTSVTNGFVQLTEFGYRSAAEIPSRRRMSQANRDDDGNRLTRKDFHNGTYEATSYDTRNRVTQVLLKNSSNATLRTQSWTYDDASNVATKTQGGVTTTFGYDDIDQLTSESRSGYSASYTYDANGNRASKTLGGVTQTYVNDDADKLTSITQGGNTVKSFSYDTAGRTTGVTVSDNTTTLAYDYEGRVTTITYPNSSTNTFAYNGLDTRVSKVDSGGTKTFLRDGAGVTAPVLADAAAVFTPSISERRSSTTTYYHGGIKNAEAQTIANETVSATVTYDAFGLPDTSSGTFKGPFGYGGPFGYQSDGDSGLMLLGHRYYDASTGRFLTRDPAKDGRNWYGYCVGNPLKHADPTGRMLAAVLAATLLANGATQGAGAGLGAGTLEDDIRRICGECGLRQYRDLPPDQRDEIHQELKEHKGRGGPRTNPDVDDEGLKEVLDPILTPAPTHPAPETEGGANSSQEFVEDAAAVGVGVAVAVIAWELIKWGVAAAAAGPTGGASLVGAAALP